MKVLADGFGKFTAELFEAEPMFQKPKGFLDVPARVTKALDVLDGMDFGVDQGRGQHLDRTLGAG